MPEFDLTRRWIFKGPFENNELRRRLGWAGATVRRVGGSGGDLLYVKVGRRIHAFMTEQPYAGLGPRSTITRPGHGLPAASILRIGDERFGWPRSASRPAVRTRSLTPGPVAAFGFTPADAWSSSFATGEARPILWRGHAGGQGNGTREGHGIVNVGPPLSI